LEEIAFNQGFIDHSGLEKLVKTYTNEYGEYLKELLD